MTIEDPVGCAWLDGVDADGNHDLKRAKARARLIRVFARIKGCSPYVFINLLRKSGYGDIAAAMIVELGPVGPPPRKGQWSQSAFDFYHESEIE